MRKIAHKKEDGLMGFRTLEIGDCVRFYHPVSFMQNGFVLAIYEEYVDIMLKAKGGVVVLKDIGIKEVMICKVLWTHIQEIL